MIFVFSIALCVMLSPNFKYFFGYFDISMLEYLHTGGEKKDLRRWNYFHICFRNRAYIIETRRPSYFKRDIQNCILHPIRDQLRLYSAEKRDNCSH